MDKRELLSIFIDDGGIGVECSVRNEEEKRIAIVALSTVLSEEASKSASHLIDIILSALGTTIHEEPTGKLGEAVIQALQKVIPVDRANSGASKEYSVKKIPKDKIISS